MQKNDVKKPYTPLRIETQRFSADDVLCSSTEIGIQWQSKWNSLGDNGFTQD